LPILPIDAGRYGTPEMRKIFEEDTRLQRMLDVEAALAWAQGEVGDIPKEDAARISQAASTKHVTIERVKKIEAEIQHDVMALTRALAEAAGSSGAYVHLGATSSDILDTATALQLGEALTILEGRLNTLEARLAKMAEKYAGTVMLGRTHGQHALPITLGLKFTVWMREISRHIERLRECRKRVLVGKITGAVGTQAGFGPNALEIQRLVMQRLGLRGVEVSTQIVQRDRYAEMICLFANIASSLEKFATEVRELQRPEIGELAEAFEAGKQVGSSTMPHKKNPITSERVCGIAKLIRGLVIPALENVPTWHERDLTQSSTERFVIPEAFILLDYIVLLMDRILSGLHVDEARMRQNFGITQGRLMSESVMLALARSGMARHEAHELVREISLASEDHATPFRETLLENEKVRALLTPEGIDRALDPENYLGTTGDQIERAIQLVKAERGARGLRE